jgi:hypothetical protein
LLASTPTHRNALAFGRRAPSSRGRSYRSQLAATRTSWLRALEIVNNKPSAVDSAAAGASPVAAPSPSPRSDPWSATTTSGREAGDPAAPVTVDLWTHDRGGLTGLDVELARSMSALADA